MKNRTLYLHIGLHKTGSKWIQKIFSLNADLLQEKSIYYPLPEGEESSSSEILTFATNAAQLFHPEMNIQDLFSKYALYDQDLLLSAEAIAQNMIRGLAEDKSKLEADVTFLKSLGFSQIRFFLLFRNPVSRLASTFNQLIKVGKLNSIPAEEDFRSFYEHISLKHVLNLSDFISGLEHCSLEIVHYDSIKEDMASPLAYWLGLDRSKMSIPHQESINRSLTFAEMYALTKLTGKSRQHAAQLTFQWIREEPSLKPDHLYPSIALQEEIWSKEADVVAALNARLPAQHQIQKILFQPFLQTDQLLFSNKQLALLIQHMQKFHDKNHFCEPVVSSINQQRTENQFFIGSSFKKWMFNFLKKRKTNEQNNISAYRSNQYWIQMD